ncbi:MAG: DUF4136 domain-containing protein [Acidobacteriota bacterium]
MRVTSSLTVVLMMLSAAGLWGQKVETRYDHSIDFRQYKTYTWRERKLLTRQSKENEKLIDQALVNAVNTQLRAKGLTEDQNAPDLFVDYSGGSTVADSKAGAAYAPHDLAGWGAGNVWTSNAIPGSVPNVWATMQGILLFEVVDAKTDSVVWSSLLKKKLKNPGKMPKDLDKVAAEIVRKAFQDFPPGATGK